MNVNNNLVIQTLRSNNAAESRDAAIATLDSFHNHQYGQFIVVKYGNETTLTTDEGEITTQPLMIAVGVEYPDKYAIVFDGDLKSTVTSVTVSENAAKAGLEVSPETGDVVIDLQWNWEYSKDDSTHIIKDNLLLKNIHRLLTTPIQETVYKTTAPTQEDTTDFTQETSSNDWMKTHYPSPDKFMLLSYTNDSNALGYITITDLIADSKFVEGVETYWWEIPDNYGVAHPEIVAPSLKSIGALKDVNDEDHKELSKRIDDVHYALHDYAEWDSKNHELDVFLNDGGPLKKIDEKGEVIDVEIDDPLKPENLMCLYIWSPDFDNYWINDEGELMRETNAKSSWKCPIIRDDEASSLSKDAEWDGRFE